MLCTHSIMNLLLKIYPCTIQLIILPQILISQRFPSQNSVYTSSYFTFDKLPGSVWYTDVSI
jgi:hypothetical protein